MDFTFPGFSPLGFRKVPDIPEMLTFGKEKEYLSSFYKGLAYNPYAIKILPLKKITQADIDEFVSHYSTPGGMRAGFEYYRAFSQDAEDNKESAANGKLTIPVLVLSGDIYPALGGDLPGSTTLKATQALAENVTGVTVPLSGHWIPEEQPQFVIGRW